MNRHFVVETFIDGEGFAVWTPINEDTIRSVEKLLSIDLFEDLSLEHPVQIKEITPEQSVEGSLNGASIDGCYSKPEQIRYCMDNNLEDWELEIIKKKYPEDYKIASTNTLEALMDN